MTRAEFQQLLRDRPPVSPADLQMFLYATKYTGPVTWHCFNGVATSAEIPGEEIVVRLDRPAHAATA